MSGIEKWFEKLVGEGKIPQTPMNYDTASYKMYVAHLEAENAALREKIEKALELPRIERLFNGKVGSYKVVYQDKNNRITSEYYSDEKREAAEARLAELKGGKHE